jgi:hypothetical protein
MHQKVDCKLCLNERLLLRATDEDQVVEVNCTTNPFRSKNLNDWAQQFREDARCWRQAETNRLKLVMHSFPNKPKVLAIGRYDRQVWLCIADVQGSHGFDRVKTLHLEMLVRELLVDGARIQTTPPLAWLFLGHWKENLVKALTPLC